MITVDEGYAEYFRNIITKPLTIVRNCKDLIGEYQPPSHKIFTLTYIGSIDHSRFFPQMLHVVGKIKDVQFIIIAKKENNFYDEVKKHAKTYKNILFLGHAVVCLFDSISKINRIGSPNKLFEAMVTGRPIIVTKGTHAGDIVEQEQCGLSVEYSEKGLEDAIKLLRDNPTLCERLGRNGLKAAQQKYNWGVQQKELLKIYENIKESTH
jgi:glycosyltransferase involved in cell wall biosynthesis